MYIAWVRIHLTRSKQFLTFRSRGYNNTLVYYISRVYRGIEGCEENGKKKDDEEPISEGGDLISGEYRCDRV